MTREELIKALEAALASQDKVNLENLAKDAVENYADDGFGYYFLAESFALDEERDYFKIETCLAKAAELDAENTKYLIRFAQIKEDESMLDDAMILYGKALRLEPDNTTALIGKAIIELREYQDYSKALELVELALEKDTNQGAWHILKAEALAGLNQNEAALAAADKGLSYGFSENGYIVKIAVLREMGRGDEVLAAYDVLLKEIPDVFVYQYNFGKELYNQEKYAAAATQLKKVADLEEKASVAVHFPLGKSLLETEDFAGAQAALSICVELEAETPDAFTLMLIAEAQIGQKDGQGALDTIEKLLPLIQGNKRKLEAVELKKAMALGLVGRYDEAIKILQPLADKPGLRQDTASYTLGAVYFEKNDAEKSYHYMKTARRTGHKKAGAFIKNNLLDHLKEMQDKVLDQYSAEFGNNAHSAVMQKLYGKFWNFRKVESKKLEKLPNNVLDNINKTLQKGSIVFTEKGLVLVSERNNENLTYKIKKEQGDAVILEFAPLDNQPSYSVKLKVKGEKLAFSKEENEVLYLEALDLGSIHTDAADTFKQHVNKDEVAYLGINAEKVLDAVL